MRIVSGKHKGRKLFTPDDYAIRPTADNVREALFNILGNVSGKKFLDLFGGSGAVSLEAVSRGASAWINDADKKSVALIKKNFDLCKESAVITNRDALAIIKAQTSPFDIVFMDPPYALDATPFLKALVESKGVDVSTLIIYEKENKSPIPQIDGLEIVDQRRYGIVGLVFYKLNGGNQ